MAVILSVKNSAMTVFPTKAAVYCLFCRRVLTDNVCSFTTSDNQFVDIRFFELCFSHFY